MNMRTILLGLIVTLALGCGDDDGSSDVGGADAASASDTGAANDTGAASDSGPGADAGSGSVEDTGPSPDAGSDAGLDVDAGGEVCGGFLGTPCSSRGDFCEYASGCGVDDRTGLCVTPPESCPRILDWVCGCDGVDYGNPCMAQMAGQSVQSRGRCEMTRCGGRGGVMCDANQYCAFTREDSCGRADATSTCMTRPRSCLDIFSPVCGCDGFDYGNECEANAAGVAVLRDGTCDEP